jgi:hypothetical protein
MTRECHEITTAKNHFTKEGHKTEATQENKIGGKDVRKRGPDIDDNVKTYVTNNFKSYPKPVA